jgi:hypothetical protein
MRTLALRAIAAGVALVLAYPVLAQQPGGGGRFGGGFGGPGGTKMLLLNKSVQDELKLTDDQKADLTKVQEKQRAAMAKARESRDDRDKAREIVTAANEEAGKEIDKWKEGGLKPDQSKRLKQIELQVGGIRAFTEADVQKELKLNEKQTGEIKDISEGLTKDVRDLFGSAGTGGDRAKMREKMEGLRKEAMEKVNGILTDEQKAKWKEMVGEKFEIKMDGPPGGQGGNGKRRPRQQDAPKSN